jgi:hypothetical protein
VLGLVRVDQDGDGGAMMDVKIIRQSDILKCRFVILIPEHYREDGSCKCDDPEHRRTMIKSWGYKRSDFKGIPLRQEAP